MGCAEVTSSTDTSVAHLMAYLLQYYDLTGWKYWDTHSSDLESTDSEAENSDLSVESTSSSSPSQSPTLEAALKAHPDLALQEIAEELGLDYDRIRSTVQTRKNARARRASVRASLQPLNSPGNPTTPQPSAPGRRSTIKLSNSSTVTRKSTRKRQRPEV